MTIPAKQLPYPEPLFIAQTVSAELQIALDAANQEFFQHEQYGHRHTVRDLDVFVERKKELFFKALHLEYALRRSQGREAILRRKVDEENQVKALESGVTAA